MSVHAPARWLVTYDIAEHRRLARVFKLLKKHGVPVQYSVFYVDASSAKMAILMTALAKLIDKHADDVRAYRIPQSPWIHTMGAAMLPTDMWLDGLQTHEAEKLA